MTGFVIYMLGCCCWGAVCGKKDLSGDWKLYGWIAISWAAIAGGLR